MSEIAPSSPDRAISTAEAVARILACADVAVGTIASSAERQVRQIEAGIEARELEDAARRQAHLEQLRRELGERAVELATAYAEVTAQLGEIDRALVRAGQTPAERAAEEAEADPRVAAIKMTLRERRRVHTFSETAPEQASAATPAEPRPETEVAPPPWADPAPAEAEPSASDAAVGWRLWNRAA